MAGFGNLAQFEIYERRNIKETELPISFEEWEALAKTLLADGPYWYVAGGAAAGNSVEQNQMALDRWRIVPRMLVDTAERDLKVNLFGQTYETPIILAPVGVQSIMRQEGELASAKAAASSRVLYTASTASSYSIEQIAEVMGDAPRWYQLYWGKDRELTKSMVQRAEKAGYSAVVVTLDTQMLAWRENDLRNKYLPFLDGIGIANYITDPSFCAQLQKSPAEDMEAAIRLWSKLYSNPSLTWKDLAFLRECTNLPIILKGILDPEDAHLALEYGVSGIIVSNHGGRQVDGSIGALDALPEVVKSVEGRIPVLFDSGIRRGADIVKAIALGANAVLIGRPFMYGLAVAGEAGVNRIIRNLIAELDLTMALIGKASLKDLNPSVLKRVE